jgi:hypothetical protein
MTEPSAPRPVPGPGRPAPGPAGPPSDQQAGGPEERTTVGGDRFAQLADRPVDEHVEVFEAEHDRLQSELGTIDRV